ncbi:hypothetical protein ACU4GD_03390 [Cupriavidus basilensis]
MATWPAASATSPPRAARRQPTTCSRRSTSTTARPGIRSTRSTTQRRTAIVMKDWYALKDPRQYFYGAYVTARGRQQGRHREELRLRGKSAACCSRCPPNGRTAWLTACCRCAMWSGAPT